MPLLQANQLTYQFDNAEILLSGISCSLAQNRVGLVGRNGAGKSILGKILSGQLQPTSGRVSCEGSIAVYEQESETQFERNLSIASYLQVDRVIEALEQVAQGCVEPHWFEIIGEQWDAKQQLQSLLQSLNLPLDDQLNCAQLSGGQWARLRLWKLFQQQADVLILDEPSNHLDVAARQWLAEQIERYPGAILLISHDRKLLNAMQQIWELNSQGLTQYGGNYSAYQQQKALQVAAIERQLEDVQKQRRKQRLQMQKNREKAEQRAAQGNAIRNSGSQPKMFQDFKQGKAERSAAARMRSEALAGEKLQRQASSLARQKEQLDKQKWHWQSEQKTQANLLRLLNGVLPFGVQQTFNMQLNAQSRLHLKGANGCGKSTLLKVLAGTQQLLSGELSMNTQTIYLDQHFSLLDPVDAILVNLKRYCPHLADSDARTLLAGIGFRGDRVHQDAASLSGGEKMKLAMLIVSHQPEQPLLLLDEPDNHLDLDAKNLLADALNRYKGAFVVVSHDTFFVEEAGVTEAFEL